MISYSNADFHEPTMLTRKMRVSVVGSLLFSRFTAYLSPFSLIPFCNTEISEFFDMAKF